MVSSSYELEEEIRFGIEGTFVILTCIAGTAYMILRYNPILKRFQKRRDTWQKKRIKVVLGCLLFGMFLRGYWMLASIRPGEWGLFYEAFQVAVHRFAVSSLFLGFVVVVLEWAKLWTTLRGDSGGFCMMNGCSILGTILVIVQLVYIMLTFFKEISARRHQEFGFDNVLVMWLSFIFSLGFFLYSKQFERQIKKAGGQSVVLTKALETVKKITQVALFCTILYLVRAILFVFGLCVFHLEVIPFNSVVEDVDYVLYPTFYYTIPDLLPTLGLLHILTPNTARSSTHERPEHSTEYLFRNQRGGRYGQHSVAIMGEPGDGKYISSDQVNEDEEGTEESEMTKDNSINGGSNIGNVKIITQTTTLSMTKQLTISEVSPGGGERTERGRTESVIAEPSKLRRKRSEDEYDTYFKRELSISSVSSHSSVSRLSDFSQSSLSSLGDQDNRRVQSKKDQAKNKSSSIVSRQIEQKKPNKQQQPQKKSSRGKPKSETEMSSRIY